MEKDSPQPRSAVPQPDVFLLWLGVLDVSAVATHVSFRSTPLRPVQDGCGGERPLVAATAMNMTGGWLSDKLAWMWGDLRRGRVVVAVAGFTLAGLAIVPGVLANNALVGLACLTIAMAGLELTVPVAWALCLDIAGDYSGSVTGVMNTLGNPGRHRLLRNDRLSGDDFRMDRAVRGVQPALRRGGGAGNASRPEPFGCGRIRS